MKGNKGNSKPRTLLQRIATQRTWFNYFIARAIYPSCVQDLILSSRTQAHIAAINNDIVKLRELVDRDWEAQRKKIKEDLTEQHK